MGVAFAATGVSARALYPADRWLVWQSDVITIVRLPNIQPGDFDWEAWRCYFFNEGYLPRAAVRHAMSFGCADEELDAMDGLAAQMNSRLVVD